MSRLVEFEQDAAALDVIGPIARHPHPITVSVDGACTTLSIPPTSFFGTVSRWVHVIVAVPSTKHLSICDPIRRLWSGEGISGYSAVPVHRQAVLVSLITDGERRVFSPVPLTVSTLDLLTTATRY